jgi:hypothetical protein
MQDLVVNGDVLVLRNVELDDGFFRIPELALDPFHLNPSGKKPAIGVRT